MGKYRIGKLCIYWSNPLLTNFHILYTFPVDTGRKLNVQKTFNLRPVSTGWKHQKIFIKGEHWPEMGHCWENTKFFCSVLSHFWNKGGKKCFRKVCKGNIGDKLVNAVKTRSFIDVFFPVFGIYFGIKSLFMKHKMKKLTRYGLKSLEGLMVVFRKFLKPLRDVSKYGVFFWFVFSRIWNGQLGYFKTQCF